MEPLEAEAHPAQVTLGEFHTQRIDSGYGLLAHVLQCELRKRGRAFGAQGQQVLGVALQPHVGREAPFDGPDVEPLAEIGKHACQHQPVEFQPDVELRGVDVVGDARGQRTALGEVQHGAHVGLLAAEVDARNLQVDVVETPHGVDFQILVEKVSVADGDVVDADLPRFGGFCGFRNGRGVRCEVRDDVVEAERVAPLVDLHVETCEGDVLHRDAIRQQRQDAHAHIETVEREKGRRVVAAADLQPLDAQAPREYVHAQPFHADRTAQQFAVVLFDVAFCHGRRGDGDAQHHDDQDGQRDQEYLIGFLHNGSDFQRCARNPLRERACRPRIPTCGPPRRSSVRRR